MASSEHQKLLLDLFAVKSDFMTNSSSQYGRIASISDLAAIFRECRGLEAGDEVVCALEQGEVSLEWVFFYAEKLCLSLYIVPRHAKEVQEPYGLVVSVDMFGEIAKHHRNIQKASIEDVVSISSLSAETLVAIEQGEVKGLND